jgi:hypothetical protein
MSSLVKAIKSINPNAKFILVGDDLTNIEWIEATAPISVSEIQTKINEIKQAEAHIYPRAKAYPSIQEQLDLQYWDKVNGTDTWEQAINAVKAQYPKA